VKWQTNLTEFRTQVADILHKMNTAKDQEEAA